jgi:hypothetical protein
VGQEGIQSYGECLAAAGHVSICCLGITSEINAKDPAFRVILEKSAHAVRIILRIDAPRAGTSSFGKDHEYLSLSQEIVAFGKSRLHFLPVASPAYRNAFRKIAQDGHEKAPLKIGPFREIPG